jgi:hypothetical protein
MVKYDEQPFSVYNRCCPFLRNDPNFLFER